MGSYPHGSELMVLRTENREMRKTIADLRKIGAEAMLQANDLKAWMCLLLAKVGPQEVTLEEYERLGFEIRAAEEGAPPEEGGFVRPTGKGIVFAVTPVKGKEGVVLLSVGDLERGTGGEGEVTPEASA